MAWIRDRRRRVEEARRHLERTLESAPESSALAQDLQHQLHTNSLASRVDAGLKGRRR